MLIRSRMGVSADGFVSTDEGLPALVLMPGFQSGVSHGFPEFIRDCDAVAMGRNTFLPALGAPQWPWPGLQVYVLTSRPLPAGVPDDVIVVPDGPAALAERLRTRGSGADVHLVAGRGPSERSRSSARSTGSSSWCCRSCSAAACRCHPARRRPRRCGCSARTGPSRTGLSSWSTKWGGQPERPVVSIRSRQLYAVSIC